jgi:RNA-directed DNA polymerase
MNSSRFEKRQLLFLGSLLHCSPKEIIYLCENIKSYYGKKIEIKTNKETGKIKTYLDGTPKQRIIRPSYRRLKEIQKNIKNNILSKIELPKNIKGGVKGNSNIANANVHKGNKYKFSTDLQEFYPSISFKKIHSMFLKLGYSDHVSHWLTKLTSIEFELPQGARTSTHIANIVFLVADDRLIKLCDNKGIKYTRWVDDLVFSSSNDFHESIEDILTMIFEADFRVSWRKTSYKGNQNITGIDVFNNFITAPKKLIEKLEKQKLAGEDISGLQRYIDNIRKHNTNAKTKYEQKHGKNPT